MEIDGILVKCYPVGAEPYVKCLSRKQDERLAQICDWLECDRFAIGETHDGQFVFRAHAKGLKLNKHPDVVPKAESPAFYHGDLIKVFRCNGYEDITSYAVTDPLPPVERNRDIPSFGQLDANGGISEREERMRKNIIDLVWWCYSSCKEKGKTTLVSDWEDDNRDHVLDSACEYVYDECLKSSPPPNESLRIQWKVRTPAEEMGDRTTYCVEVSYDPQYKPSGTKRPQESPDERGQAKFFKSG